MSDDNVPDSTKSGQALERTSAGYRLRLRFGEGKQGRFTIKVDDEAEAERRAKLLRELSAALMRSKRRSVEIGVILRTLAETTDDKAFRSTLDVVQASLARPAKQRERKVTTFAELAADWTSGRLHARFPDHVKAKRSADDDAARFLVLNKAVGQIPLGAFRLEDAQRAMASLPENLSSATRRQYAQLLSKVLRLAVYPCQLVDVSPLPPGFLPKVKSNKAKSWLYPAEEALLLGNRQIPLGRRLLWGVLAREGMRLGEAMALRWADLDLERGTVRLDENKTDDPRLWALGRDVVAALAACKPKGARPDALVFPPFEGGPGRAARIFRDDLTASKVTRTEIHEQTDTRMAIRVHDLRGTFVTLALAADRSEAWVSDRTGHKSSVMINRYRRAARSASELRLGWLSPLDQALPESRSELVGESEGESERRLTESVAPPKSRQLINFGSIAQSVELRTFNP